MESRNFHKVISRLGLTKTQIILTGIYNKAILLDQEQKWGKIGKNPKYICKIESYNQVIMDQQHILQKPKSFYLKLFCKTNQINNEYIQSICNNEIK